MFGVPPSGGALCLVREPTKVGTPNYTNSTITDSESSLLVTRDEWPLPLISSTSNALPAENRRDSPSLAVTSHSPARTKNIVRADEMCQSLVQPAGAFMKRK